MASWILSNGVSNSLSVCECLTDWRLFFFIKKKTWRQGTCLPISLREKEFKVFKRAQNMYRDGKGQLGRVVHELKRLTEGMPPRLRLVFYFQEKG